MTTMTTTMIRALGEVFCHSVIVVIFWPVMKPFHNAIMKPFHNAIS